MQIKAVIFDIDGTLTSSVSWTTLTKLLGADPKSHDEIYKDFLNQKITYDLAKQKLLILWKSTDKANKNDMEKAFEKILLRTEAQEVVEYLKQKYKLCLISGSMDLFVENIAKRLAIKDWHANTVLEFDNNGNLIDFDYERNQAEKKLIQFSEFCKVNQLKMSECCIIGDSENDQLIFDVAGLPILYKNTATSQELLDKTQIHIKNLSELMKIL